MRKRIVILSISLIFLMVSVVFAKTYIYKYNSKEHNSHNENNVLSENESEIYEEAKKLYTVINSDNKNVVASIGNKKITQKDLEIYMSLNSNINDDELLHKYIEDEILYEKALEENIKLDSTDEKQIEKSSEYYTENSNEFKNIGIDNIDEYRKIVSKDMRKAFLIIEFKHSIISKIQRGAFKTDDTKINSKCKKYNEMKKEFIKTKRGLDKMVKLRYEILDDYIEILKEKSNINIY